MRGARETSSVTGEGDPYSGDAAEQLPISGVTGALALQGVAGAAQQYSSGFMLWGKGHTL